jgi:hypothetical protein
MGVRVVASNMRRLEQETTMADVIVLADRFAISGATGSSVLQPLLERAMDVSAYDQLDLQFVIHSIDNVAGVKFTMTTAMILSNIDDAGINQPTLSNTPSNSSWSSIGQTAVLAPALGKSMWYGMSFPAATPMFRYLRYRAELQAGTGTTSMTFSILGMGRRRVT